MKFLLAISALLPLFFVSSLAIPTPVATVIRADTPTKVAQIHPTSFVADSDIDEGGPLDVDAVATSAPTADTTSVESEENEEAVVKSKKGKKVKAAKKAKKAKKQALGTETPTGPATATQLVQASVQTAAFVPSVPPPGTY